MVVIGICASILVGGRGSTGFCTVMVIGGAHTTLLGGGRRPTRFTTVMVIGAHTIYHA